MKLQSNEGTVESEQSASNSDAKEQKQEPTLLSQLLEEAQADGHIIGPPDPEKKLESSGNKDAEVPEIPENEQETEEITAEAETEETEEEAGEEEEKPVVEGKKSIDDQLKEFAAKGEKPPWYLSRIADETRKRQKANTVAQGLWEENQRLKSELEQTTVAATAPRPNGKDPLADIFDERGLERMTSMYKSVIRLAELNPDGAYEVAFKGPDGKETKKDFTREQLVDMKLDAEEGLRSLIPQRRQYLSARISKDNEARKVYPELADEQSGWVQTGMQFLRNMPELQRDPECWLWIARAIRGWQIEQGKSAEGKKASPKESAAKILAAKAQKKAPITPTSRGMIRKATGADLDAAKKQLAERGDQDAAEKYLESLGVGGGPKSKRQQLVEA